MLLLQLFTVILVQLILQPLLGQYLESFLCSCVTYSKWKQTGYLADALIIGAFNGRSLCWGSNVTWGLFTLCKSFQPLWSECIEGRPALCPAWKPCPGARHRWHERNPELWKKKKNNASTAGLTGWQWWNKLNVHSTRIHLWLCNLSLELILYFASLFCAVSCFTSGSVACIMDLNLHLEL